MASLDPHSGLLGERLAKHLLRRASYKVTADRIQSFAVMTAAQAVDALFVPTPLQLTEPLNAETGQPWINDPNAVEPSQWKQRNYIRAWWLQEMYNDESIVSKMMIFLHQYLALHTDAANTIYMYDYLSLLRFYALGSYKTLAHKMVTDNIMSDYLDNRWNHQWNPNENFAREFMELFTIGKGPQIAPGNYTNYTEDDVQEAARLLTGFRFGDRENADHLDPDTGITRNFVLLTHHDPNPKTFSSAFGNQTIDAGTDEAGVWNELETFVDMIFDQDATAVTLCRRLYRYFVSYEITPAVESSIIQPLATICKNNNYDLTVTVQTLLKSQHFFSDGAGENSDKNIGKLIKSPLDNVLHTMSFFNIQPPNPLTDTMNNYESFWSYSVKDVMLGQANFILLEPDNVAGYAAYYQDPSYNRDWFSSATIIARYKIPEQFLTGYRILSWGTLGGVTFDMVNFVQYGGVVSDPSNASLMVTELCDYLFAEAPDSARLDYLTNDVFLAGILPNEWANSEWAGYLSSGDDTGVRIALDRLFKGLVYSQEFQIM